MGRLLASLATRVFRFYFDFGFAPLDGARAVRALGRFATAYGTLTLASC